MIAVNMIVVEDRQREVDATQVESLADSISRHGLLQPIVVEELPDGKYKLLAGGHRLEAHIFLNKTKIPAVTKKDISSDDAMLIEWEENFRRKQLDWKEEAQVFFKLHTMKTTEDEEWTIEKTGAFFLVTERQAFVRLTVGRAIDQKIPQVLNAEGLIAAYNAAERNSNRALEKEVAQILEVFDKPKPIETLFEEDEDTEDILTDLVKQTPIDEIILYEDFLKWAPNYDGKRFSFIHLDPPYGIKHSKSKQGGSPRFATYSDTPEDYLEFLDCLCTNLDRIAYPQAHVMLWLALPKLSLTKAFLEERIPTLRWGGSAKGEDPVPLIWFKSDSTGIIPDTERGGRRVYEGAIHFSIGDRKVVQPVNNCFPHAGRKDAHTRHLSEKPVDMLYHFFRMFVDSDTEVLDPCFGSGSSLVAANRLKASRILGLDSDPDAVDGARTYFAINR